MSDSTKTIRAKIRGRWAKTAYIMLPGHPGDVPACVARSVALRDYVSGVIDPSIMLDFDRQDRLIGIEILAPTSEARRPCGLV
jgi:hypothetical protein